MKSANKITEEDYHLPSQCLRTPCFYCEDLHLLRCPCLWVTGAAVGWLSLVLMWNLAGILGDPKEPLPCNHIIFLEKLNDNVVRPKKYLTK